MKPQNTLFYFQEHYKVKVKLKLKNNPLGE